MDRRILVFILITLVCLCSCEKNANPQVLHLASTINKSVELDYLLYLPYLYDENTQWPLVLYLTGSEAVGDIDRIRAQGPPAHIEGGMKNNFFLLAPQLPGDVHWDAEGLMVLLNKIKEDYPIDSGRIYVTGSGDRGGWGTWDVATSYPDYFSRIAPVSAPACTEICRVGKGAIRIYHGAKDQMAPLADAENMHFELDYYCKSDVQLKIYPEGNHEIADSVYSDPDFWNWFADSYEVKQNLIQQPMVGHFRTALTREVEDNYLLYLPRGYKKQKNWPLVLFLHGSGSAIDDIEKIRTVGPPKVFESGRSSEFIVLAPQLHDNVPWDVERVYEVLKHVSAEHRVDPDRVYVTGLSRGGFGTWELAVSHPHTFAAVAPIAARDVPGVERLKDTNIWIFHGHEDDGVPWQGSQFMFNRLKAVGANVQFSLLEGVGHNAWDPAYENDEFWEWLLSQSLEDEKVVIDDI